jgi:hypothetical protein
MRQDTPPTRHPSDRPEDRRTAPIQAGSIWAAPSAGHSGAPAVVSQAAIAECRCPTDCIRDHEND